jgi:hypothetical protein
VTFIAGSLSCDTDIVGAKGKLCGVVFIGIGRRPDPWRRWRGNPIAPIAYERLRAQIEQTTLNAEAGPIRIPVSFDIAASPALGVRLQSTSTAHIAGRDACQNENTTQRPCPYGRR